MLRALALGDLLTGVPALRAIRRLLPEHEVVLACPAVYAPLMRLTGDVDRICPVAGLGEPISTTIRPDVAIDLHGRGPESHRRLQALGPRRLLAFGCEGFDGPVWRQDEHEVRRWCRLVAESFRADVDPGDLELMVPPLDTTWKQTVVIHPGAAHEARRWPVERFAQVAAWVASQGFPVVVTGSTDELRLAQRLAICAGLPESSILAGRLDLTQLAALVSDARLVICGDTGVAHLATAYRTPSVVLFGPLAPSLWGPPDLPQHIALWRGTTSGDPWGQVVDPALLSISCAEVIAAAANLLGQPERGSARPTPLRPFAPQDH